MAAPETPKLNTPNQLAATSTVTVHFLQIFLNTNASLGFITIC
jgi:hypothetical protein